MSRDPEMFIYPELIYKFKELCKSAGIIVIITSVGRCELEQMALYSQGRRPLNEVNIKRGIAGLPPITEKQNKVVTWTLASRHIPVIVKLDDEGNPVKRSKAFDFAVIRDHVPVWDIKVDTDSSGSSDYMECGIIGESLGLNYGGRWKSPDYCHLEWRNKQ